MATYIKIATVTVGAGGAASMDFTSIPSTYTDLLLSVSGRGSGAAVSGSIIIKFNAITTGYSSRNLYGNGATATSNSSSDGYIGEMISAANSTASIFGSGLVYIPNYAGSTNKSYSADWVSENNATTAYAGFTAGLMSNTAAINAITLTASFVQHSTATLYGISKS